MLSVLVNLLRGRVLWLLLIGISAASAAGFAAGWKVGTDRLKADLYSQVQEAYRVQQEAFRAEIARRDRILAEREREMQRRRQQIWYWRQRYEQAKQTEPDCAAWARSPLPRCAVERLRRDLSAGRAGAPRAPGQPD